MISNYIYLNRKDILKKYIYYSRGNEEYILEPERIKKELIESYKSKTRNDMKSIAKLLDIKLKKKKMQKR